jgi:NitT/TauT family transport system substrate-binding protein
MSMQALLSGSTQFAQVAGDVTVGAALKGADIVTIAANLNRHVFFLVSQPAITTPDDLKGKRIGIVRFGGMNQWVATLELEALGLDSRDVVLLQAGNVAERLIAMERNLIDASVFSYPELVRLKKMGYRVLLDPGSLKSYFPTSTIAARREYLERNRDVAKNFLRSYTDAIYVIRTQRETAIKVMAKYTRLTDQEVLGQTYDFLARNMEPIPKVNLKGVESVLAELAKGEGIKKVVAKDLVESSLLDELERAGFFTRPQ